MVSRYRGQIVLLLDVCLIFACNFMLFLPALFRGDILFLNLVLHIGFLSVCVLLFQLLFRTYNSLWRYAESREYFVLLAGMSLGFALYSACNFAAGANRIWISRALTGSALALLAMLAERFLYRMYRMKVSNRGRRGRYAAIIGAGTSGVTLLGELRSNPDSRYTPYCMIDDASDKMDKHIHGIPVRGPIDNLEEILQNTPVTDIILAISNLPPQRRTEILHVCAATKCHLHIFEDPMTQLERETTSLASQVREVRIEDLLGRPPVQLDNRRIDALIRGKTVMVTGGGGSIGSELCRQIANYSPRRLVILDIAENTTYELQNDLLHCHGRDFPLSVEIASIRDQEKLDRIFARYRPELVFHAAAHKHVPLMERCPEEAVKNNVLGTYHAALSARKYGTEKFVLISTDKAVNPTNIMGTTKYLCEQVIQGLRQAGGTEFAAVRFGNVLGSSGSVIPLFEKQIAYGGPVTVTDRRIIRYFMTIPEAAQLVLEAGSFAHSGEVYVLDMGEPVHIWDLAEKLIRLSGYTPGVDIKIEEVGLRPGEKLYEELLTRDANLRRTENEKIFVEKKPLVDQEEMAVWLRKLEDVAENGSREQIFQTLHRLVPTFRDPDEVNAAAIRAAECPKAAAAALR